MAGDEQGGITRRVRSSRRHDTHTDCILRPRVQSKLRNHKESRRAVANSCADIKKPHFRVPTDRHGSITSLAELV